MTTTGRVALLSLLLGLTQVTHAQADPRKSYDWLLRYPTADVSRDCDADCQRRRKDFVDELHRIEQEKADRREEAPRKRP